MKHTPTAILVGIIAAFLAVFIRLPIDYHGDGLQVLCWIKAASQWDFVPFMSKINSRLGAPFGANWNDYPFYEEVWIFALGRIAAWFGLLTAANVGLVMTHATSAMAFYLCCKHRHCSTAWSASLSLIFAFTYFHFAQGFGHLFLCFAYVVPIAVLASRNQLSLPASLIAAVLLGWGSPYNLAVFLALLSFTYGWTRKNGRRALLVGAVSIVAFLLINMDTITYQLKHGRPEDVGLRNYIQCFWYALRPIELIIRPNDSAYAEQTKLAFLGERGSPYLGVIGIWGLTWIVIEAFKRRKATNDIIQATSVIAFSTVGGIASLIAFGTGFYWLRASNRFSLFLSAIVLLFLASRLTMTTKYIPQALRVLMAGFVAFFGLADQIPFPKSTPDQTMQSDQKFGQAMELLLPPDSAVFQLPSMRFPEGGPANAMQEYEHLRPYLFTDKLRFSFGNCSGRHNSTWAEQLCQQPAPTVLFNLRLFGFSAIYLNRRGFADAGQAILRELHKLNCPVLIDDGEQVLIGL